jgi:hypothetical protein
MLLNNFAKVKFKITVICNMILSSFPIFSWVRLHQKGNRRRWVCRVITICMKFPGIMHISFSIWRGRINLLKLPILAVLWNILFVNETCWYNNHIVQSLYCAMKCSGVMCSVQM